MIVVVSSYFAEIFFNKIVFVFQASGVPGYNGLSSIKMEEGMSSALGGVKVGRSFFIIQINKVLKL